MVGEGRIVILNSDIFFLMRKASYLKKKITQRAGHCQKGHLTGSKIYSRGKSFQCNFEEDMTKYQSFK